MATVPPKWSESLSLSYYENPSNSVAISPCTLQSGCQDDHHFVTDRDSGSRSLLRSRYRGNRSRRSRFSLSCRGNRASRGSSLKSLSFLTGSVGVRCPLRGMAGWGCSRRACGLVAVGAVPLAAAGASLGAAGSSVRVALSLPPAAAAAAASRASRSFVRCTIWA